MNIYHKQYTDDEFEKGTMNAPGKMFDFDYYDTIIYSNKNSTGYYIDTYGKKQVLYKLLTNSVNKHLQDIATTSFKTLAKTKKFNRGIAAGKEVGIDNVRYNLQGQSMSVKSSTSNIAGYYDKPDRMHKKYFDTSVACRKTSFTRKNIDMWINALPFIQRCSELYKQHGGKYFLSQKKHYNRISKELKIPNSVFTTITVNYNWRTACHKDSGDFSDGLGNLIVTGQNFKGCFLGFPQFKICIEVKPGDLLLMDVHQWHCNTELFYTKPDGFRMSYVMYIRKNMYKCNKKITIDKYEYLKPI